MLPVLPINRRPFTSPPRAFVPALPYVHFVLRCHWRPRNYPRVLKTLGDHLQKRRLDLGLTWKAVAAALGVNPSTVTNWTKGRTEPVASIWPGIIEFLGCDPRQEPTTLSDEKASENFSVAILSE